MKGFLTLRSVEEIYDIIENLIPLSSQIVSLTDAFGRFIRKDFIANSDLPGFPRSVMDGYAARAQDIFGSSESSPSLLKCIAEGRVGKKPDYCLKSGETAYIPTGGMLPEGADCVVMVEYCRLAKNSLVEVTRSEGPGCNIISANEDASSGEVLISKGTQIRAPEIGILASFGIESIEVGRKPTLAMISTGDEIVPISTIPREAQIRDVNSHTLAALARNFNADVENMGIAGDKSDELSCIIEKAMKTADVIVISGGSSAGMRDKTLEVFEALPNSEILAHGVAVRPGKPFIFAKSGTKALLGLPGHVASALISAHLFLVPLIQHLQGSRKLLNTFPLEAIIDRSIASELGRRDYIRCTLSLQEGNLLAHPLLDSSATIMGMVKADGLIICPENSEGFIKGSKVKVLPLQ